ncbi:hypothetical protein BAE44_0004586, partial [Dichanthelium oligosanthes]
LLLAAAAVAVASLPALASATDWMVGDDGGWRAKFNQTGWPERQDFHGRRHPAVHVPQGEPHGGRGRRRGLRGVCNLNGNLINSWTSGNDVVHLDKAG